MSGNCDRNQLTGHLETHIHHWHGFSCFVTIAAFWEEATSHTDKKLQQLLIRQVQKNIGCSSEKPRQWWLTTCSHSSFLGFWKKQSYCSIPCSTCSLSSDCHSLLWPEEMLQDRQNTNSLNNHQSTLLHTTTLLNMALLESLVTNNSGFTVHSHGKIIF